MEKQLVQTTIHSTVVRDDLYLVKVAYFYSDGDIKIKEYSYNSVDEVNAKVNQVIKEVKDAESGNLEGC